MYFLVVGPGLNHLPSFCTFPLSEACLLCVDIPYSTVCKIMFSFDRHRIDVFHLGC